MTKIGILGYGNLARGVESAIRQNPDMELVAVFTRRDPASVSIATDGAVCDSVGNIAKYKDRIDVLLSAVVQLRIFRNRHLYTLRCLTALTALTHTPTFRNILRQ